MSFTTKTPWYSTGTITTDGTTKIIGVSTVFMDVGQIAVGDMLSLDGSKFYQIQKVGDGITNGDGSSGTAAGSQSGNNTILVVDRAIPAGAGQTYTILKLSAVNPVNSDIAYKVSAMVQSWQGRENELIAWLGGVAGGGANNDGKYPMTDAIGTTYQVNSPAQMQADVDSMINTAIGAKNTLDSAVALATQSAADSAMQAQAAWTAALAANPDLNPQVRMNPQQVITDLTIPDNYNAYASGPLEVAMGVTITVGKNANLNII